MNIIEEKTFEEYNGVPITRTREVVRDNHNRLSTILMLRCPSTKKSRRIWYFDRMDDMNLKNIYDDLVTKVEKGTKHFEYPQCEVCEERFALINPKKRFCSVTCQMKKYVQKYYWKK